MASVKDLGLIWRNVKEVDLRPIREEALRSLKIALVGAPGVGRHTLAAQMRRDPSRPGIQTQSPVMIASLDQAGAVSGAHLIILMVDATQVDTSRELELAKKWNEAGFRILVFCNKFDLLGEGQLSSDLLVWSADRVLCGSLTDEIFLLREFTPTIMEILPEYHLALGRLFPLFRVGIARHLINEACFANATYALSTGIAEIVPVLNLPLNITDMVVLTKTQAFLAYKLGLQFGFSTRWQDYITEFGSVIGGGFLWRQLARQIVGLVPVLGIVPKVAVSYSGTYVVGNAILQWYITGRHLSASQMRALSVQAFARGKSFAQKVGAKVPRLRRGRKAELPPPETEPALTLPEIVPAQPAQVSGKRSLWSKKGEKPPPGSAEQPAKTPRRKAGRRKMGEAPVLYTQACPQCGKPNAADASFCQYCGSHLTLS